MSFSLSNAIHIHVQRHANGTVSACLARAIYEPIRRSRPRWAAPHGSTSSRSSDLDQFFDLPVCSVLPVRSVCRMLGTSVQRSAGALDGHPPVRAACARRRPHAGRGGQRHLDVHAFDADRCIAATHAHTHTHTHTRTQRMNARTDGDGRTDGRTRARRVRADLHKG